MHNLDNLLLEQEINELGNELKNLMSNYINLLKEDVTSLGTPAGDLAAEFDEASKRFEAAKRGWSIVNSKGKFLRPELRTETRRRITGNLNRLRALVDKIIMQTERDHQDTTKPTPQFNPQQQGWMGARQQQGGPQQGQQGPTRQGTNQPVRPQGQQQRQQ